MLFSKFPVGAVFMSDYVKRILKEANPEDWRAELKALLWRHITGDWGDVSAAVAEANEVSLKHGGPIRSAYTTAAGLKLEVVTQLDPGTTTIDILPAEP
jgi:hypothetical protein